MMRKAWEEFAAERCLKSTFFCMIDAESVRTQYQAFSCKGSRESIDGEAPGVYCAQWWASYHRLQPGSASGSQCVESFHAHKFRGAFVNLKTGEQIRKLPPDRFVPALEQAHV